MEENHVLKLVAKEVEYLKQVGSCDQSLATLLRFQEDPHGRATICLSRAEAARLMDYLGTQLAMFGFNEDYSPNEQGQLLEALIDKLFFR